jgi:16S rRNA (adenine1518-N6/adenine1519-N6)-dimethyltransferase
MGRMPLLIDILDRYGNFTGKQASRKDIHTLGLIHRAVHLYLVDKKGYLLMQKRAETVDHYPNEWSISLTGHVDAGESSSEALQGSTGRTRLGLCCHEF